MYKLIKRLIDILISLITLIILLPLLIPIVIALKLTGEGEIFYLQKRVGYKNKYFDILKFATMLKNSPSMGTGSLTLRNDPRVTTVGKYLRITKINELPQVINVLKGNMTLVGPRPQMKVDFEAFPEYIQEVIYDAKPGITGIGSIIFRDEEEIISNSDLSPRECYVQIIAPYKGELELWYQKNASTYTDLMIIFLTAWAIVSPKSELHFKVFKDLPKRQ